MTRQDKLDSLSIDTRFPWANEEQKKLLLFEFDFQYRLGISHGMSDMRKAYLRGQKSILRALQYDAEKWGTELVLQLMQWMPDKYRGIFDDKNIFEETENWAKDSLTDLLNKYNDRLCLIKKENK